MTPQQTHDLIEQTIQSVAFPLDKTNYTARLDYGPAFPADALLAQDETLLDGLALPYLAAICNAAEAGPDLPLPYPKPGHLPGSVEGLLNAAERLGVGAEGWDVQDDSWVAFLRPSFGGAVHLEYNRNALEDELYGGIARCLAETLLWMQRPAQTLGAAGEPMQVSAAATALQGQVCIRAGVLAAHHFRALQARQAAFERGAIRFLDGPLAGGID